MEIRVENLKARSRTLIFEEPIEDFPVLRELMERGEVAFLGGVSAKLVASLAGSLVEVDGSLSCRAVFPCSRCLQPVEQSLDLDVTLSFSHQTGAPPNVERDLELTDEEVGLIPFEGDVIDLRSPIEQELLMAFPQHSLCSANCKGLCPVCGVDLNHRRCDCVSPVFHGGFAALEKFKVTKD